MRLDGRTRKGGGGADKNQFNFWQSQNERGSGKNTTSWQISYTKQKKVDRKIGNAGVAQSREGVGHDRPLKGRGTSGQKDKPAVFLKKINPLSN